MSDSDTSFSWFVRTPFPVEATQITEANIHEVAELVGEVRTKDGEQYIALDRRIVPNVGRAHLGWFLTRLGDNLRCYSPKIFREQFIEMPDYQPVAFNISYGSDQDPSVSLASGQRTVVDYAAQDAREEILEVAQKISDRSFARAADTLTPDQTLQTD